MIFREPQLTPDDRAVLELIENQRKRLANHTNSNPRRWLGSLRRQTFARAMMGSNSIEGYNATLDEAIAAIEDEPPLDERSETWHALGGYQGALTYVMQAARDPAFEFGKQFLKSLHFLMTGYDLKKNPGQWRPGSINVVDQKTGKVEYVAPDVELVDELIDELVDYIRAKTAQSSIVKAAMAHLNLTMIHPFSDGNGRMARALQTLIIALDGTLDPAFCSIEEWLGRYTLEYYEVLRATGQGKWSPQNSAHAWLKFCLTAHYQQAHALLRRLDDYGKLYDEIEALVKAQELPERACLPLFDAALGVSLTNSRYKDETQMSFHIAGRDLKRLSDLGLIDPQGDGRGRRYVAGKVLRDIRAKTRTRQPPPNPYDLLTDRGKNHQPPLPGLEP